MTTNMRLEWEESFDENDNSIWEANSCVAASEGDMPFQFRIKQKLEKNEIIWYDASDEDLGKIENTSSYPGNLKEKLKIKNNYIGQTNLKV